MACGVIVTPTVELRHNNPSQTVRKAVSIDMCIVAEVYRLWQNGVITKGCCCGHGDSVGHIAVSVESIPIMKRLGYKSQEHGEEFFTPKTQIVLREDIQQMKDRINEESSLQYMKSEDEGDDHAGASWAFSKSLEIINSYL